MELKDKVVLITGGNAGLGLEIARKILEKGSNVIILGKDQQKLEEAKLALNSEKVRTLKCDLRNYDEIKTVLKEVKDVDVLINNAGMIAYKKLDEQDPQNIKDIIEVNLLGTIFVTRELLPIFKKKNSGTILNISSTSGLPTGGHAEESVYVASKYGVTGFTETLKKEINEENLNIRILGFYPGGMKTDLFNKSGIKKDTSNFMDPKEIAEIVVFMVERPEGVMMDHIVINRNKNIG